MAVWIRSGTVTLTGGSKAVAGTGTAWLANVMEGDQFNTPTGPYEVESVANDGSLQLATAYAGPTASNIAYSIVPTQGRIVPVAKKLSDLLTNVGAMKDAYQAGDIADAADLALTAKKTELATATSLTSGASGIGFQLSGTGTHPRDLHEVFSEEVRLMDFIPKAERAAIMAGLSTYDASADISRAISFCSLLPNGTELVGPRGMFRCNSTIPWKNKVRFRGKGKRATVFEFTGTGAGFKSSNPINASTGAYSELSHCAVINTSGGSTDGGFVDIGGTYVDLLSVRFTGWKYGTIFDQTEIATIHRCEYAFNTTGGVWLVNGPTYTPGGANGFTNQITITAGQFNANGIGIIDDGGVNHTFDENNFNGGGRAMWLAGARVVSACRNEIEYCTTEGILLTGVRQSNGTGVGQCFEVAIEKNFFIANVNTPCVRFVNGTAITLRSNDFQTTNTSTSYAAMGCANVNGLISEANTQTFFVDTLDAVPAKLLQTDPSIPGMRFTRTQFYSPANTDSALETYSPSSAGGGTSIGGIDLSGNNASGTKAVYAKVRPAIYGNGAGAEAGGLHIDLAVGGVSTFSYSFLASVFRPSADNVKALGQANLRWSGVYTHALSLSAAGIPVFADNGAATTAGLPLGTVFRTSAGVLLMRF